MYFLYVLFGVAVGAGPFPYTESFQPFVGVVSAHGSFSDVLLEATVDDDVHTFVVALVAGWACCAPHSLSVHLNS